MSFFTPVLDNILSFSSNSDENAGKSESLSNKENEEKKENSLMCLLKEVSEVVRISNQIDCDEEYTFRLHALETQMFVRKINDLTLSLLNSVIEYMSPYCPEAGALTEEEEFWNLAKARDMNENTKMNILYEKVEFCVDKLLEKVDLCLNKHKEQKRDKQRPRENNVLMHTKDKGNKSRIHEKQSEFQQLIESQIKKIDNASSASKMFDGKNKGNSKSCYEEFKICCEVYDAKNYKNNKKEMHIINLSEKPQRHFLHLINNFCDKFVPPSTSKHFSSAQSEETFDRTLYQTDESESEEREESEEKEEKEGKEECDKNCNVPHNRSILGVDSCSAVSHNRVEESEEKIEEDDDEWHYESKKYFLNVEALEAYIQKRRKRIERTLVFPHPYESELNSVDWFDTTNSKMINIASPDKRISASLSDSHMVLVENTEQLIEMIEEIDNGLHKEIAIDVEHHSIHSYKGFVCLIQLSSRDKDWLIDPFLMFPDLHCLNRLTANPNIVKVFHGADNDIIWLQRDFGIYVVNLFDTYQAARELNISGGYSLKNLLKTYCNVETKKQYQLADWRQRPLSEAMKTYSRIDTHYLLYIYDMLKNQLLCRSSTNPATTPLGFEKDLQITQFGIESFRRVMDKCKKICLKKYKFKDFDEFDVALSLLTNSNGKKNKFNRNFKRRVANNKRKVNILSFVTLVNILRWRDYRSRVFDESASFILNNYYALRIAQLNIKSIAELQNSIRPLPFFVRIFEDEIFQVILESQKFVEQNISRSPRQFCIDLFELDNEKQRSNKEKRIAEENDLQEETSENFKLNLRTNKKLKLEGKITSKACDKNSKKPSLAQILETEEVLSNFYDDKLPAENASYFQSNQESSNIVDSKSSDDISNDISLNEERVKTKDNLNNTLNRLINVFFDGKKTSLKPMECTSLEDALFMKRNCMKVKKMSKQKEKSMSLCHSIHSSLKRKNIFKSASWPSLDISKIMNENSSSGNIVRKEIAEVKDEEKRYIDEKNMTEEEEEENVECEENSLKLLDSLIINKNHFSYRALGGALSKETKRRKRKKANVNRNNSEKNENAKDVMENEGEERCRKEKKENAGEEGKCSFDIPSFLPSFSFKQHCGTPLDLSSFLSKKNQNSHFDLNKIAKDNKLFDSEKKVVESENSKQVKSSSVVLVNRLKIFNRNKISKGNRKK